MRRRTEHSAVAGICCDETRLEGRGGCGGIYLELVGELECRYTEIPRRQILSVRLEDLEKKRRVS